jgi:uncharacterized protein YdcH (DUF465 family)
MITKEKLQNHIEHLKEKHKEVDKLLIEADAHWEDNERINNLKKQKLQIKDEIARLEKQIGGL